MSKLFAFVAVLALLSLSSAALAESQHNDVLLAKIVVIEDAPILLAVTVENERDVDFSNGKVVLSIPELGARASGRLSVGGSGRETSRVLLDLPLGAPSGDYWLRIVVTNEDAKRVRHRLITIG